MSSNIQQLEDLKNQYKFVEPNRGNLDDPNIKWRTTKPNYLKANLAYFQGKTMNHKADTIEKLVEDLVKTWEMEASNKVDFSQWTTIDHDNYSICANGGKLFKGKNAKENGNYNCLLDCCKKELYDSTKEDFESSHKLFNNTFTNGFPWELLHVFSGPPKVAFSWRHWGKFDGVYKDNKGDNQIKELYGFAVVQVNENIKIQSIEIFYKPDEFLEVLEGKRDQSDLQKGKSIIGTGCPFISKTF